MGKRRRGKDPNAWQLRYLEGSGADRRLVEVTFFGTAREADARLAKLKALAKSGRSTGTRGRTPFHKFAEDWMKDRREQILLRADDPLSPYTVAFDESRVRQHLMPTFGKLRMEQIGPKEIDAAVRRWKNTPVQRGTTMLSPKSVSNLYIVLRKMLADAVRWNYIEWNPCERCVPPAGKTHKVAATPLADAAKLLAYPSLSPVHVCCLTALFTGLRRGELLALRREDLDLEQGTIWCEKAVAMWDKRVVTKAVKTDNERGRRMQPLAPVLRTILTAYLLSNPTIVGPLFSACGQRDAWSCRDGQPMTPDAYSTAERRHLKKVGIRGSAQTLRHAFNSLQGAAGVDLALRAVLMGHSTSKLTETTYQTVWMEQKQAAVDALADLIAGAKPLPAVDWEESPPFE